MARVQSISSVARDARAIRVVVDHRAFCVDAARSRTRVHATVVDACLIVRAFGIQNALWTATRVRISEIARNASTRSSTVVFSAFCVRTTGRWVARLTFHFDRYR